MPLQRPAKDATMNKTKTNRLQQRSFACLHVCLFCFVFVCLFVCLLAYLLAGLVHCLPACLPACLVGWLVGWLLLLLLLLVATTTTQINSNIHKTTSPAKDATMNKPKPKLLLHSLSESLCLSATDNAGCNERLAALAPCSSKTLLD